MDNSAINLLTHFYNEEYLLPFWIEWHRKIPFKKVILVDYSSTDKSVEIIKKNAPSHWTIIQSRNKYFGAQECDAEMMDLEAQLSGWKICLNTTEFFMPTKDISEILKDLNALSDKRKMPVACGCETMVVTGKSAEQYPSSLREFVAEFKYGYKGCNISLRKMRNPILFMEELRRKWVRPFPRSRRFLHNSTHGEYTVGRHNTLIEKVESPNSIFIAWCGFYPWNQNLLNRKLQIKSKVPQSDIDRKWGFQHLWGEKKLMTQRARALAVSSDLTLSSKNYADAYNYILETA